MLGLKRGIVKLMPYQKQWQNEFLKEKDYLHSLFGDKIRIEHVGSTSVKGLLAKPIIDIILGLTSDINLEQIKTILSTNQYNDRGDEFVEGEYLFVKGTEDIRTHHLHLIDYNSNLWKNYIFFRNYLKSDKTALNQYNQLKLELARKFATDRKAYTASKADFIQKILKITEKIR